MADVTKIEWTDATQNFWWGCQSVGPGCDHCYAEALDKRTGGAHWGAKVARRRTSEANWNAPLKWQRDADKFEAEHGRRRRVFCGSMMDIMDNAVPLEWSHEAFARIEECDRLDWQLLTKRGGNVGKRVPDRWTRHGGWPRHVGLMITVVNQEEADRDIPKLLEIKEEFDIPWVGLSCEPMLGPIDLRRIDFGNGLFLDARFGTYGKRAVGSTFEEASAAVAALGPLPERTCSVDWVIAGGESGPHTRPSNPEWFRSLRDQCVKAHVPYLFKQHGEWRDVENGCAETWPAHQRHKWPDGNVSVRKGKKAAGRLLDGIEHNGFPEVRAA